MKFDAIVGNPPFGRRTWVKFIKESNKMADVIMMISPSCLDINSSQFNTMKKLMIDNHIQDIIDQSSWFDVTATQPISLYYFDHNKKSNSALFDIEQDPIIKSILNKANDIGLLNGFLESNFSFGTPVKDKTAKALSKITQDSFEFEDMQNEYIRLIDSNDYFFVNRFFGNSSKDNLVELNSGMVFVYCPGAVPIKKPYGHDADSFKTIYLSKLMRFIFDQYKNKIKRFACHMVRKLPIIPPDVLDLYQYFGLTQEEIDYVETYK